MKCLRTIFAIVSAFLIVGCWDSSTLLWNDQAVAKVDGKVLSKDELRSMLPQNIDASDSMSYVDAIVNKWVINQLKIREAEQLFSKDMNDIEKKVADYRMSLLVKKLDEYWTLSNIAAEITPQMVREYYDQHKDQFKLSSAIVRGVIVSFSNGYQRQAKLRSMMKADGKEKREDFVAFCKKSNFSIRLFDEWTLFSDFMGYLPLATSEKHDQLLNNKGVQEISQNGRIFLFRIYEAHYPGDAMPFEMTTDNINKILSNRIRREIVQQMEKKTYDDAVEQGKLKFYYSEH